MVSFIIVPFVVVKLYILKGFRSSRKLDFWLLLSGFSWITPSNEVGFVQNFHQWCTARKCITYITVFHKMLKIPKNSAQNLNLWLIFGSFSITPSYALSFTPQFLYQIKGLMEMYNRGKFHLYSISGCEVKKSEMFSWQWSIHEMVHFWAFSGPKFPKCGPILLKFASQLLLKESKTLL